MVQKKCHMDPTKSFLLSSEYTGKWNRRNKVIDNSQNNKSPNLYSLKPYILYFLIWFEEWISHGPQEQTPSSSSSTKSCQNLISLKGMDTRISNHVKLRFLCRWEESVEIEWQRIEFFIPIIPPKCPELGPPCHPSILLRLLHLYRVVQKHGHHQPDCRSRHEYRV